MGKKKENTGTKLNVLLCNLVDYVRGDDRPLVFAVMQEITEYFEQELDRAREEVLIELKDELLEQIEKGRKYEIYGGVADYQDALHLVGNMLSKLTTK